MVTGARSSVCDPRARVDRRHARGRSQHGASARRCGHWARARGSRRLCLAARRAHARRSHGPYRSSALAVSRPRAAAGAREARGEWLRDTGLTEGAVQLSDVRQQRAALGEAPAWDRGRACAASRVQRGPLRAGRPHRAHQRHRDDRKRDGWPRVARLHRVWPRPRRRR